MSAEGRDAHLEGAPKDRGPSERLQLPPVSVNWHVWPSCNYHCTFCYATFAEMVNVLRKDESLTVPRLLRAAGTEKLTFAGGEPTLCPYLSDLLREAKTAGLVTMIVTNGTRLTDTYIDRIRPWVDWIAVSVDSVSSEVETRLGRGRGNHVEQTIEAAQRIRARGIRLKVNTVVTADTWREDMHPLISLLKPERWKVFQVLPIRRENDRFDQQGYISREQFADFLERHQDLDPVGEDNDAMTGSYVMLDPLGRFFQNTTGEYTLSDSILTVGVKNALRQVGWDPSKFVRRGGIFDWVLSGNSGGNVPHR